MYNFLSHSIFEVFPLLARVTLTLIKKQRLWQRRYTSLHDFGVCFNACGRQHIPFYMVGVFFSTSASMVGSRFQDPTRHTHRRRTTTDYTLTDFTPATSHQQLRSNDFAPTISHQRLHTNDFAPTTSHERLHTNDFTRTTSHQRLHTNNFTPTNHIN